MRTSRRTPGQRAAAATVTIVATVALVGSSAVGVGPLPAPPAQAAELSAFADCAEMLRYLEAQAESRRSAWGEDAGRAPGGGAAGGDGARRAVAAASGAAPAAAARSSEAAAGVGATGTNLQEQGVDEADLAKTDGRLVVTVADGRLRVLDATDDQPRLLGSLQLTSAPRELLLLPGRALVIGEGYAASAGDARRPPATPAPGRDAVARPNLVPPSPHGSTRTVVTLVDLADPSTPRVLGSDELSGNYLSARLLDGVARLVTSDSPRALPWQRRDQREDHRSAEQVLPRRVLRDEAGRVRADEPLLGCAEVRRPRVPAGSGLLTVLTYDLRSPDPLRAAHPAAIMSDGDLVYTSTDRLYIATTDGGGRCTLDVCVRGGIGGPGWGSAGGRTTRIHAFDATRRDGSAYLASGSVDGYLLNRWAMSEHQGVLRVATTSDADAASAVVTLEQRGSALRQVGRVGGLGRGERVRGVRWLGDLVAVVTFRQTDPLYLVDLASPGRPRLLGELKVPGYSAYLHPLGNNLLLGVGQDADPRTGEVRGAQLSVFDIADRTRPRRVDVIGLGAGTSTLAESDARAFAYLPERRLVVLPGRGYDEQRGWSGALGFAVDPAGGVREAGLAQLGEDVVRVLPVGERLAAVGDRSVTLLDPQLQVLGRAVFPAP